MCIRDSTHTIDSYSEDETSPLFSDPYNQEDYSYSILSKALVKKPAKPVAGAAKPVIRDECKDESAQRSLLEDSGRVTALHSSKTGLASQSSTETDQTRSIQSQTTP